MTSHNTPIFVINLLKSIERKSFIEQQFSQLEKDHININYQFFPAINGKEDPSFYLFKKYNAQKRFQRKGNYMNLSQLGCFASHYLLWEKCIELNQPIIILEDDAIIKPNFREVYNFISSQTEFEFLWLSCPAPARQLQKHKEILKINENCSVHQFYEGWGNTTAYYITPKAAQRLLNYTSEWIYEVDITMERYWENKLSYLGVKPFCIQPNFELESNIPVDKGRKERTFMIKLKREFYNIKDKLSKQIYLAKHS
ncbi:hypothetical protein RO21_06580 [[Actinobacillus] muris]|uniref:Glycosyl transferase family 25 domain-containing protein n=1 Tax=Muribacter muris TaxID=67855 RepID=A0A0J5P7B4_9PAST|nr:glycosyltransferase family 25 protein [Muribacter muris]KMK51369.1 hypothetical protein RO21_06580 [[Actinobacillus] muris] [Muribacter muris]